MNEDEYRVPYPLERLVLLMAFLLGVFLLFIAVRYEAHKFPALVAEAVGTAFLLVVIMDVFFSYVRYKARAKDRETITEIQSALAQSRQFLKDSKIERIDDSIQTIKDAVKELGDRVDRVLGRLP